MSNDSGYRRGRGRRAMQTVVLVLVSAGGAAAWPAAAPAQTRDPARAIDYRALWESGRTYAEFYAAATARRALWERNTEEAIVPSDALARARAAAVPLRLLVVAFDRCSDSVETVPYLAALADRVEGLELRIVDPDVGRPVMEAHRTPDGRAATPTVVVLDGAWEPVGAWVERPAELQRWMLENPEGLSHDERYLRKMAWYAEDAGRSTIEEVVSVIDNR